MFDDFRIEVEARPAVLRRVEHPGGHDHGKLVRPESPDRDPRKFVIESMESRVELARFEIHDLFGIPVQVEDQPSVGIELVDHHRDRGMSSRRPDAPIAEQERLEGAINQGRHLFLASKSERVGPEAGLGSLQQACQFDRRPNVSQGIVGFRGVGVDAIGGRHVTEGEGDRPILVGRPLDPVPAAGGPGEAERREEIEPRVAVHPFTVVGRKQIPPGGEADDLVVVAETVPTGGGRSGATEHRQHLLGEG